MTIHTFPVSSQPDAVSEITTCTMTLLDDTVCTSEADRQINGDTRECYKCGEAVCKRHHSVLVLRKVEVYGYMAIDERGFVRSVSSYEAKLIDKYAGLSICTTCAIGEKLAANADKLAAAAENSYEGKVSRSLGELDEIIDELTEIAEQMRTATAPKV